MSIYRFDRRIGLILEGPHGIKQSKEIIPENKKKLFECEEYLRAKGTSFPRQDKLLRTLKKLATLLGSIYFKEARAKDHQTVLRLIV